MTGSSKPSAIKIFVAPLQGYTEAPFRHFHAEMFLPPDTYFSPFIRIEKGVPRPRDIRDISSPLNDNHNLIPQIIFKDTEEFSALTKAVSTQGYDKIDLNLGCPFPPQVRHGRGAAMITRPDTLYAISKTMEKYPDIRFSVKMRLGTTSPDQWRDIAAPLNSMNLSHVTIHPRTAAQQYSGELHLEQISDFIDTINHHIIFNGEIVTTDDIRHIADLFPKLHGVMIGRGLLKNPWLIEQYSGYPEPTPEEQIGRLCRFHDAIFEYYSSVLCGDCQILAKIKPFWDYSATLIGSKAFKAIHKSKNLGSYNQVIRSIAENASERS